MWASGDPLTSTNLNSKGGAFTAYNVQEFGAVGTADDTAVVQQAFAQVGNGGGELIIPARLTMTLTSTVTYTPGIVVRGQSGPANVGKFVWGGAAGGTMFTSATPAASNEYTRWKALEIDGASLASFGLDFYRVSHGLAEDCYIHNAWANVRLYRDAASGYGCYFNNIVRGKIANGTYGVLLDGAGVSHTNGPNSNWLQFIDFENNATSVYQKYGNELFILGCTSEHPLNAHFELAGWGAHIIGCRLEDSSASATVPGILIDSTAQGVVEVGNYWANFTNDPVVDNQASGDHILRFSTYGSGVNGGQQGYQAVNILGALALYGRTGYGLLDLNGGDRNATTPGTIRINRSSTCSGDLMDFYNGSSVQVASVDSTGLITGTALSGTTATGYTVNATNNLRVGTSGATGVRAVIQSQDSYNKDLVWASGGDRWVGRVVGQNVTPGAGDNFALSARTDDGTLIDTPLSVVRASGGTLTIARPLVYSWLSTPLGTDSAVTGQMAYDANYIYIATSANSWRRATLAKF